MGSAGGVLRLSGSASFTVGTGCTEYLILSRLFYHPHVLQVSFLMS